MKRIEKRIIKGKEGEFKLEVYQEDNGYLSAQILLDLGASFRLYFEDHGGDHLFLQVAYYGEDMGEAEPDLEFIGGSPKDQLIHMMEEEERQQEEEEALLYYETPEGVDELLKGFGALRCSDMNEMDREGLFYKQLKLLESEFRQYF